MDFKIGDKVFVSANNLIMYDDKNCLKKYEICAKQDDEVEVLGFENNLCKIKYKDIECYVIKEGLSAYNPNKKYLDYEPESNTYSKNALLANLDFDMDVSVQSNLSLEQFEKIFENQSKDVNGIFKENAKYFYYAEEQYNINGLFLAAIAIHESAWGTSSIAKNKKNLFGYCAYDSDPYNSASNFESYAEGIDLVARVLANNYLNSSGTVIYNGNIASGRYFSGKTISSVNKHYATDKNWANCVYKWLGDLYNSIPE